MRTKSASLLHSEAKESTLLVRPTFGGNMNEGRVVQRGFLVYPLCTTGNSLDGTLYTTYTYRKVLSDGEFVSYSADVTVCATEREAKERAEQWTGYD